MPTYKYKAISKMGVKNDGFINGTDEADAIARLRNSNSVIISLKVVDESKDVFKGLQKVNEKALGLVCRQFANVMKAGLPIVRTVELVAGQTENKRLKKLLTDVSNDVAAGYGLADSFRKRDKNLPTTFIETLRAGEYSGHLDTAFERLAAYFSKKSKVKNKVVSALVYPVFVIVVAVIVIAVIMIVAIPKFTEAFVTLGTELPLPTRLLIGFSNFFVDYGLFFLALIALLVAIVMIYNRTEKGHLALAELRLKLPVIGKIQLMNGCSQFANTMSTMISAGLTAVRSLTITGRTLSNAYLGRSVLKVVEGVEGGFRIGDGMKRENVFPELLSEMTAVGEESGSLEETLTAIAEYYDEEVEAATNRAVGLLEPIIIVILSVFVLFVLLAVYLPMFNMYGSM